MRIVDTIQAIPTFILLLIIASMYSLDLATIILVLSVLSWAGVARLVRAHVLVLREKDFIHAAMIEGAGRGGSSTGTSCPTRSTSSSSAQRLPWPTPSMRCQR